MMASAQQQRTPWNRLGAIVESHLWHNTVLTGDLSSHTTHFHYLSPVLSIVKCPADGNVAWFGQVWSKEEGTSHSRGENQWCLALQTIQNQLCTPSWGKPTVR